VHASAQQTPSTQFFETHVRPDLQDAPFASSDRTSAVAVTVVDDVLPPVTSTRPFASAVAV
jgi:hypothetical protein